MGTRNVVSQRCKGLRGLVLAVSLFALPLTAQSTDLEIQKVAGATTVHSGDVVSYTVTVTNHGPSAATNVQWTDTLTTHLDFESLTAPAGWNCTTPPVFFGAGGTITCARASFGVTSDVFTVVLRVRSSAPGDIVVANNATVSASTSDPNPANNTGGDTIVTTIEADMAIQKNHNFAVPGSNFDYAIDVTNYGPSDGASLTMTDVLPPLVTFVSISPAGWACTTPPVGSTGTVTCTRPSFNALATTSLVLTVHLPLVPPNTTVSNTVSIGALSPDSYLANNSETTSFVANASNIDVPFLSSAGMIALALLLGMAAIFMLEH